MRPTLLASILILAGPADDGRPLLDGADPGQFELVGIARESIAIERAEVRLTGKPIGYFATRSDFKDFALTFEWKHDRPPDLLDDARSRANGGVLLRVARPHRVWPDAVEVQLAQADPGAIFALGPTPIRARSDPEAQKAAVRPVGQWNRSEIQCRGGSIVSILNGVEVARAEGVRPDPGPIAWQSEGTPIRFRDIRIRPIP